MCENISDLVASSAVASLAAAAGPSGGEGHKRKPGAGRGVHLSSFQIDMKEEH